MAKVIDMPGVTYAGVPPDKVLEAAIGQLEEVVIIGVPKDKNDLNYFAASTADGTKVLWLLEGCKNALFQSNRVWLEESD